MRVRFRRLLIASLVVLSVNAGRAQSGIQYVYDDLSRLIAVIDPNGDTATYTYDAVGNILSIGRHASSQVSIISFSPATGPNGTTVTISGTGFSTTASQNTVTFNGTSASVSTASSTQLVVTVPSGATTGAIGVTAPAGSATSANAFVVGTMGPSITSFTPSIGIAGTSVTVSGTNFTTAPKNLVLFNGLGGAIVSSTTTTSVATTVPTNGTSGRISVSTPTGIATSSGDFFVPPSPYVASDVVSTGRVALGSAISVPVGTANKIGLVVFDGTIDQRVSLKIVPGPISAVTIYRPNGLVLANTSAAVVTLIEPQTLPATGTYAINVDPVGSGTGTTTLTPYDVPPDVSGTITPTQAGASANADLSVPGRNARYTVGTPGNTRVSLRASGPIGGVTVQNPDGTTLTSGGMNSIPGFIEPWTYASGQAIKVDPSGPNAGTATITAYDVPADLTGTLTPTTTGGAVSSPLSVPGQNALYTLGAPTNTRVSLALSSGPSGTVSVRNPDGSTLTSASMGFPGFIEPWTYASGQTIKVDPSSLNTGTVTLTAYDVSPDVTGSLTIGGGAVAVTTMVPGQNARYTFNGTASQQVTVHITSNGIGATTVKLLGTDGVTVLASSTSSFNFNLSTVTLPSSGTYTVLVDPNGANKGTLNLSVTSP